VCRSRVSRHFLSEMPYIVHLTLPISELLPPDLVERQLGDSDSSSYTTDTA